MKLNILYFTGQYALCKVSQSSLFMWEYKISSSWNIDVYGRIQLLIFDFY